MKPLLAFILIFGLCSLAYSQESPEAMALEQKLNAIILPDIEFHSTLITDAVEYLRQEGKRLGGSEVNVFLKIDQSQASTRLTLKLGRVPLLEAFKYVANQANLQIAMEPYALRITPRQNTSASQPATEQLAQQQFDASVAESWKRVQLTYPDTANSTTPAYTFLQAQINDLFKSDPNTFRQPTWPETLAARYATQLQALKTTVISVAVPTPRPALSESPEVSFVPQETPQPTQRNGQPLPSNWIDPSRADMQWQTMQIQKAAQQAQEAAAAAQRARRGW